MDSVAHLANFFMSVSPDVPMDEMASALFKALEEKPDGSVRTTGDVLNLLIAINHVIGTKMNSNKR